jgi:hypothetical protein
VIDARLQIGWVGLDDELDAGRLDAFNGGFHEPSPEKGPRRIASWGFY